MITQNNTNDDEPKPTDLEWCQHLIRITKNNAIWGIPRSGTTFRFDKENKQLVLVIPGNDDGADLLATRRHFEHLGWKVIDPNEINQQKPEK